MADPEVKKHGKEAAKLMQSRKDELPKTMLEPETEAKLLTVSSDFIGKNFSCNVVVNPEEDPESKSRYALPMKPGIYIT
jgi:hypothetical protein